MADPVHTIVDTIATPGPTWDVLPFDSYLYVIVSDAADPLAGSALQKIALDSKTVSDRLTQYAVAPLAMIDFGRPLDGPPDAMGYGAPDRRIYANTGAGDLVEVVPAWRDSDVVRPVLSGEYVPDIIVSPQLRVVYFADPAGQRVGVYDPDDAAVMRYVPIGGNPYGVHALALSPDGRHLYAAPAGQDEIAIFDTTEAAPRVTMRYPRTSGGVKGMTVTPDGKRLLVWQESTAQLVIVDLETGQKSEAQVGIDPTDVVVNDASTRAYVSSSRGATVSVVDLTPAAPRTIATITGFAEPRGLCLSADNRRLYVSDAGRAADGRYGIRVVAV